MKKKLSLWDDEGITKSDEEIYKMHVQQQWEGIQRRMNDTIGDTGPFYITHSWSHQDYVFDENIKRIENLHYQILPPVQGEPLRMRYLPRQLSVSTLAYANFAILFEPEMSPQCDEDVD